jgi:hypothetical protein
MNPHPAHKNVAAAVFFLWVCVGAVTVEAEKLELPPGISLWNESASLRAGLGYKDNVTLSSTGSNGSAFEAAGFDLLVFRLPWNNWQFNFFASGSDTRYFEQSVGVDTEQRAAASGQLIWLLGNGWKSLSTAQYSYLNQVLDVSATTQTQIRQKVLGHTVTGRQGVRKDFSPYWAEAIFGISRHFFGRPLDDYWQGGPQLTLGRTYGHGSDLSLSYQIQEAQFDTFEQARPDGTLISGAPLEFRVQSVELASQHHWDTQRRWRSSTRLSAQWTRDNGPGYYDYFQYRVAEQLRYRATTWEVSAQLSVTQYDFDGRTVSATDLTTQDRTPILFSLRGEKRLAKSWKLYASYDYERSHSNVELQRYEANVGLAGIEYSF